VSEQWVEDVGGPVGVPRFERLFRDAMSVHSDASRFSVTRRGMSRSLSRAGSECSGVSVTDYETQDFAALLQKGA
jgi:hypothetical protein